MEIPDELLDLLMRSGFEAQGDWTFATGERGDQWQLAPPGTARYVYFRMHADTQGLYSLYVEEWRGGEGYEDEEFRGNLSEALTAIPNWVAWANEPFEPTPSKWERFLRRFREGDSQPE